MPAIKLRELKPGANRHHDVWRLLGERSLCARKVKDGEGVYFVIVPDCEIESFLSEENVRFFLRNGFEVKPPPEMEALRTIVIRNLDRQIDHYTETDIQNNIEESNPGVTVLEVVKLPTTSKLLKVKLATRDGTTWLTEESKYLIITYLMDKWKKRHT